MDLFDGGITALNAIKRPDIIAPTEHNRPAPAKYCCSRSRWVGRAGRTNIIDSYRKELILITGQPRARYAKFNGEDLFLIDGVLSELQTAHTRVDLLEGLQQRMLARRVGSDTLAAVAGMHDVLAGASLMTWYEGEETVNFAALLDAHIVCGTFRNANALANGDRIEAVVSRRGELLYVRSLRRARDQLLLLPLNTYAGTRALLRSSIRHVCVGVLGMWLVIGGFFGISAMMEDDTGPVQIDNLISLGIMVAIIPILIMLFSEVPSYREMRHYGRYASAIFHVHGFPHPDDLHALKGMASFPGTPNDFSEINAALALEKHAARFP